MNPAYLPLMGANPGMISVAAASSPRRHGSAAPAPTPLEREDATWLDLLMLLGLTLGLVLMVVGSFAVGAALTVSGYSDAVAGWAVGGGLLLTAVAYCAALCWAVRP